MTLKNQVVHQVSFLFLFLKMSIIYFVMNYLLKKRDFHKLINNGLILLYHLDLKHYMDCAIDVEDIPTQYLFLLSFYHRLHQNHNPTMITNLQLINQKTTKNMCKYHTSSYNLKYILFVSISRLNVNFTGKIKNKK